LFCSPIVLASVKRPSPHQMPQAAVSALDGSHVRDGYDPAEDDPAHVESVLVKPQSWPQPQSTDELVV
jgi:hypothetical protein